MVLAFQMQDKFKQALTENVAAFALDKTGLVTGTGAMETGTGGRPAELYRFCRDQAISTGAPGLSTPRRSAD